MTTEILGFIIIIGAVIVYMARRQLQKVEDDPEVLEASAGRLRYELEQSADEIIDRMASHIDHLERLLKEADYKSELLQRRLDDVQSLYQAGLDRNKFQAVSQSNGYEAMEHEQAAQNNEQDFSGMLLDAMEADSKRDDGNTAAAGYYETDAEPDTSVSDDFSKAMEAIREVSMDLENRQKSMGLSTEQEEIQPIEKPAEYNQADTNDMGEAGLAIEAATDMARKLLRAGYSPEQVAQASGLGLGAVSLLMQMERK